MTREEFIQKWGLKAFEGRDMLTKDLIELAELENSINGEYFNIVLGEDYVSSTWKESRPVKFDGPLPDHISV